MNSPVSEHNEPEHTSAGAEKKSPPPTSHAELELPHRFHYKLCGHCDRLDLTVRSFVVNAHYAATQQRPLYDKKGPRKGRLLRTGEDDLDLPSFEEIKSNALTCRLCKLIERAIDKCTPQDIDKAQLTCKIRWEVDGHQELSTASYVNRTRRLRLSWTDATTEQSWAAFFIMIDENAASAPNSDVTVFRSKRGTFKGREVQQGQGKQALVKSWLDICRKEHKSACGIATQRAGFEKLVEEPYFGVIDVADLQLKPLPRDHHGRPAKFVALSYVWGQMEKPYVTTRLNIPWRRQHGGLETDLHNFPLAIRDAIELVQKLNLRYLWVDALCIVQDSTSSFRLNSADMHTIYGNAHFTICAADGVDASTGLRAMQSDIDGNAAFQDSEQVAPGLRLQIARPPEMVIKYTKWNTRGWTFQERILSRRCVVFADGRAYFQCRKAAFSEDVYNDPTGSGWSLQSMGAPMRTFPEIKQRSVSFYMRCVAMFYHRQLTQPSDVLAAFKGIQSVMELVMCAPFCYGLPTSHFDLALLWQPSKAIRRRVPAERPQCTTTHNGQCDCKLQGDDFNGQEFPSWSWCGWTGGDVSYDQSALAGSLLTVCEWLRSHTWIRYHILDGRGKLRPLWDVKKVAEDGSSEYRWRGYRGLRGRQSDAVPQNMDLTSSDSEGAIDVQVGVRPQRPIQRYDFEVRRSELKEHKDHGHYTIPTKNTIPEPGYDYLQDRTRSRPRREGSHEPRDSIRDSIPIYEDYDARQRSRIVYDDRRRSYRGRSRTRSRSRSRERLSDHKHSRRRKGSYDEHHSLSEDADRWFERRRSALEDDTYVAIDTWGRLFDRTPQHEDYRADHFNWTHPDNPYRVRKTGWCWPDPSLDFPDLPILQFWSMLKQLRVVSVTELKGTGLTRCHVADAADDWCGTVTVNSDWIEQHDGEMVNFVALSEAKTFTKEEDPNWNYYTPQERDESEWEVYYALLVELNEQKHVWERVGLAKIFKDAFDANKWKEIMLG